MTLLDDLAEIVGPTHVFSGNDTKRWAADWTGQYVGTPRAVVRPATTNEVAQVLRLANAREIPVVPVSGNTGLNGGTLGTDAIMVAFERMNRVREIRADARVAVVEAGVIVDRLNAAAQEHDLFFPLSFGATGSAMIGGVLSTNAGGANVLRYGNARDLCLGLEVVLPDGRVMNLMQALHKDNSGFDLRNLMIGAEGQLGVITAAVVTLHPRPVEHLTAMVAMETLERSCELLNAIQDSSDNAVVAFEFMPRSFIEGHLRISSNAREPFAAPHPVNLLVELAATKAGALEEVLEEVLADWMERGDVTDAIIAQNEAQRRDMWERREAAADIAFHRQPVLSADVAVPRESVAAYLDAIEPRLRAIDPACEVLSVAHLGDGNIHYSCHTQDKSLLPALRAEIDALAMDMNGSFSAEHGVGLSKLPAMARHKDPVAQEVMHAIKAALDPKGILNRGKTLPQTYSSPASDGAEGE